MIKGNTIYFGYGDVLVGSKPFSNHITLKLIEPPKEIGSSPEIGTFTELQQITLKVDSGHLSKLMSINLQIVTDFEIDDYILDFSKFNKDSVKVVVDCIFNALYGDGFCLAC